MELLFKDSWRTGTTEGEEKWCSERKRRSRRIEGHRNQSKQEFEKVNTASRLDAANWKW